MSGAVSNNIFAALQKKKKPASRNKDVETTKDDNAVDKHAELEKAIFSGPSTTPSNWADDSEDEWDAPVHGMTEEGWNQVCHLK